MEPLVQTGPADCGLVALEMVLSFHGAKDIRAALRRELGFSGTGTNVHEIVMAARAVGFGADAFGVPFVQLSDMPLPAILHWRPGHYVVLERITRRRFVIVDPAIGRLSIRSDEFRRQYSGIAIAIDAPKSRPPAFERAAPKLLSRLSSSFTQLLIVASVVVLGALAYAIAAAQVGILVESLLLGNMNWQALSLLTLWFSVVVGAELGLVTLDRGIISAVGAATVREFVDGVVDASPEFITSRSARSLEFAAVDADPIFNQEFPRPSGVMRTLAILILMAFLATTASHIAPVVLLLAIVLFVPYAKAWSRKSNLGSQRSLHAVRELLRGLCLRPEDLLALGRLEYALREWMAARGTAARLLSQGTALRVNGLGLGLTVTAASITVLTEYHRTGLPLPTAIHALLLASAALVMCSNVIVEVERLLKVRTALRRVREIRQEVPASVEQLERLPLRSNHVTPLIECQNISYRTSANSTQILRCVSLAVDPGESIAIVGESGAGKTILAQILLGMRTPDEGVVRAAGIDMRTASRLDRGCVISGVLDDAMPTDGTIDGFLRVTGEKSQETIRAACMTMGIDEWRRLRR